MGRTQGAPRTGLSPPGCVDGAPMGEGEGAGAASDAVERRGRGGGRSRADREPQRSEDRSVSPAACWSVEDGCGPFLGVGVERVEVGPLRGLRVGVVKLLLNVPQVEQLSAVGRAGLVHDACPGSAQIVRSDMPEIGGGGPPGDEAEHVARLLQGVAPGDVPATGRSNAGLLATDEGIVGRERTPNGSFVAAQVLVQHLTHPGTDDDLAWPVLLADPLDGRRFLHQAKGADGERDEFLRPCSGQSQPQHKSITEPVVGGRVAGREQLFVRLLLREPPGRAFALLLAVQARKVQEWIAVPVLQRLDEGGVGQVVPNAPAQEDGGAGQALPDAVVRRNPPTPGEDVGLRQLARVGAAGRGEQVREVAEVLLVGLRVRVAGAELCDECGWRSRWSPVQADDLRRGLRIKPAVS